MAVPALPSGESKSRRDTRGTESVAGTWVNQLGLNQTDPNVWRDRLTEAFTQGVWDPKVTFGLADQYLAEDRQTFAGGDDVALPTTEEAANALRTMAVQVRRDAFPAGAHSGLRQESRVGRAQRTEPCPARNLMVQIRNGVETWHCAGYRL